MLVGGVRHGVRGDHGPFRPGVLARIVVRCRHAFVLAVGRAGRGRLAAPIDREVYLPKVWAADADRRATAGVPEQAGFATKTTLGRRMLACALDAGVPAQWCTADEFYGGDRHLRRDLQPST